VFFIFYTDTGMFDVSRVVVYQQRPFDELPPEILSVIFSFVPCTKSLGRLLRVCKRFQERLKLDQHLWKNLCLQFWNDRGFQNKVSLEKIFLEVNSFDASRNWTWFASAIAWEDRENGLSFKKFNTLAGRSLISIGEMNKSKLNSFGIEIYLDGSTFYFGNFVEGKLHGKGGIIWDGGARYFGDWQDGHREGFGIYSWANGDRYEGEFKYDGKKEGKGVFIYADGDRFEGYYKNDERDGWGKMIWKSSNFIYEGNFVHNEPEDSEGCIHPQLQEAITKKVCTGTVTGKSLDFGQFFYECECADYCAVCWNSCPHTRHSSGEGYKWIRRWSDGTYCACLDRESCIRRATNEPPAKKQKATQD